MLKNIAAIILFLGLLSGGVAAMDLQYKIIPDALYSNDEILVQVVSKQKIKKISVAINEKMYQLDTTPSAWQIKIPFENKTHMKEVKVKVFVKDFQDEVIELSKSIPVVVPDKK